MLYRIELRNLCRSVLADAGTLAGDRVFQVIAWPTTLQNTPAIYVAAPQDSASNTGRGAGDFIRTATIQTFGIVADRDIGVVQRQIDQLAEQIELAILTSHDLLAAVTQVGSFHSLTELSAEQSVYSASVTSVFDLEYVETFPLSGPDLKAVTGKIGGL